MRARVRAWSTLIRFIKKISYCKRKEEVKSPHCAGKGKDSPEGADESR